MSRYIIPQKHSDHSYLLWISAFLLIFNVYHTKLISFVLPMSSGVTFVVQGAAVTLLIFYLIIDKKLALSDIRILPIEWLLILSLLVIVFSTNNIGDDLTYIIRYAVLILIVILMKYDEKMPRAFFYCILAAGIIHVVATVFFYFDLDFYLKNIYPTFDSHQRAHLYAQAYRNHHAVGLSNNYSQNGIYMAIAFCSLFSLFYSRHRKGIWWKAALTVTALTALVLTGKRAVLIFSVFAVLMTYVMSKKGVFANKLISGVLVVSIVMLILYFLSFYVEGIAASFDRLFASFDNSNESFDVSNGRFKLYSIAWGFFKDSPIFGIGWREFNKVVVDYFNQDSVLRDTHNVFLQLLCETGIIGFTAFVSLFVTSITMTIKLVLSSLKHDEDFSEFLSADYRMILIFALCYQVFFISFCTTGNPLYDLETVYIYLLSIGVVTGVYFRHQDDWNRIRMKRGFGSVYIK